MNKRPAPSKPVFQKYAELYDLFYAEKDYSAESTYILELLSKHLRKKPRSILDLGCGTGGHALLWASKGIEVTGIDRSEVMLSHATRKANKQKCSIQFVQADVRNFNLKKKFDTVASMFAVMSYQTTREDLLSTFRCVRKHLRTGGVFVFDAWFGPGVIADPPGDRVKSFLNKNTEILRTAKSVHNMQDQRVDVHYDILLIDGEAIKERVREVHAMHYFFPQEVNELADATGFRMLECHPFLKRSEMLTISDWNATFVLRAK